MLYSLFLLWFWALTTWIIWACVKRGASWWLILRFWATTALYVNLFGLLCQMVFPGLGLPESLGYYAGFLPSMALTTWIIWKRIPKQDS